MAYQKLETRDDDLEVWACDGLCFSPSRVVADILLLAGAHAETGTFLGPDEDSQSAYLREISRTLSSISLYCRQQMTSFFHRYGTEVPTKEKIARLKKDYPSADQAISAFVGILECRETGELKPLRFYDMIGKLCHVEKWTYPVSSTFKGRCTKGGEIDCTEKCAVQIEVTIRGNEPVSGNTETCFVYIPRFADAARVFVTGCVECQLAQVPEAADC